MRRARGVRDAPVPTQPISASSVRVDFTPTDVAADRRVGREGGRQHYVDTIYMTAKTGIYGLGNRPGRFDFNSGPVPNPAAGIDDMWPYGRRITTFPVWAHRHGMTFPLVVFQDGDENNLSHSRRPELDRAPAVLPAAQPHRHSQCWRRRATDRSGIPARARRRSTPTRARSRRRDVALPAARGSRRKQMQDSAVGRDVPRASTRSMRSRERHRAGGTPTAALVAGADGSPPGDYVLWIEVARRSTSTRRYNATVFPAPTGIAYADVRRAVSRSAVGRLQGAVHRRSRRSTVGVDDRLRRLRRSDRHDGTLNAPDATITTDTPGSGALRLQLVSDNGMYRVRVRRPTPQADSGGSGRADRASSRSPSTSTTATLQLRRARRRRPRRRGHELRGSHPRQQRDDRRQLRRLDAGRRDRRRRRARASSRRSSSRASCRRPTTGSASARSTIATTPSPIAVTHADDRGPRGRLGRCVLRRDRGVRLADGERRRDAAPVSATRCCARRCSASSPSRPTTRSVPRSPGVVGESDLLRATARGVLAPIVDAVRKLAY